MMKVIVKYLTDKNEIKKFEEKVAYFKIFLLYNSGDKLQVSNNVKNQIFKCLLDKMEDNDRMI